MDLPATLEIAAALDEPPTDEAAPIGTRFGAGIDDLGVLGKEAAVERWSDLRLAGQ